MVTAALSGEYRETTRQEIVLPQFKPSDFELFVRLTHAIAFCDPPEISAPAIRYCAASPSSPVSTAACNCTLQCKGTERHQLCEQCGQVQCGAAVRRQCN